MSCVTTLTISRLLNEAYQKIGVKSDDRALSGKQIKEGVDLLNSLLDEFSSENLLIAYDSMISFNLVSGQRDYVISQEVGADVAANRLVTLKYVWITKDNLQYPVEIVDDDYFYARYVNLTISRRPDQVFLQNAIEKTTLTFLQKPNENYAVGLKGKFTLNHINSVTTPITEIPKYYFLFLTDAMGKGLNSIYPGSVWTAEDEARYIERKNNLRNTNDIDLTVKTGVSLNGRM